MFRYLVPICLSLLLYGSSASPFKSWGKEDKEAQETRSDDLNEKMMWGIKKAEPLDELDVTEFDIDFDTLIWKAAKQLRKQKYNEPEEDKDNLYHPSELQIQADEAQQMSAEETELRKSIMYTSPEEDKDHLYHGDIIDQLAEQSAPVMEVVNDEPKGIYTEPEEDRDHLYHN